MTLSVLPDLFVSALVLVGFYIPVAIAWVVVFRAQRTLNFAVGELALLAAFTLYWLITSAGLPLLLAIPIALLATGAIGALIYGVAVRPLAGQPPLSTIMLTLGLAILLTSVMSLVFGTEFRSLSIGLSGSTSWQLPGGARLSPLGLGTIVAGVVVAGSVLGYLRWTRSGIQMRAAAEIPLLATQSGVRIHRVIASVWALCAVSAGVAGILFASSSLLNQEVIGIGLRGIAPAIVGGLDSVKGAIYGALLVALVETVGVFYLGGQARDAIVYGIILVVLMIRPFGLFGTPDVKRI